MDVENVLIRCPSGSQYAFPLPTDKIEHLLPSDWLNRSFSMPPHIDSADEDHVRRAMVAVTYVAQVEASVKKRFYVPVQSGLRQWARFARLDASKNPDLKKFADDAAGILFDWGDGLNDFLKDFTEHPQVVAELREFGKPKLRRARAFWNSRLSFIGYWMARLAVEYGRLRRQGHKPDAIAEAILRNRLALLWPY